MKKIFCLLLSVALLVGSSSLSLYAGAKSSVYYVDSVKGKDTNSGLSSSKPWKTLEKASSKTYQPGDKILLKKGGIYTGTFVAQGGGQKNDPVTLSSYGKGEKPILRNPTPAGAAIMLVNASGWRVENLELTSPEGGGIMVLAYDAQVENLSIGGCVFHDISNRREDVSKFVSAIYMGGVGKGSRITNVTVSDCEIYDCAYGINTNAENTESGGENFISVEESYNRDFLIDSVSLHDIGFDGITVTATNHMVIRNCSLINTCLYSDSFTAPVWMHHSNDILIENCEVAGTKNLLDGMTVDFDGWSTNCTYQYIYSHDNTRFMSNNCFDKYTNNDNCTVRYCLSVNDNRFSNRACFLNYSKSKPITDMSRGMTNFKFYNNTIINASLFTFAHLKDPVIANNIFVGKNADVTGIEKTLPDKETAKKGNGGITNNCFYGFIAPAGAKNSFYCVPGFAGTDESDVKSFRLNKNSPLLGAGVTLDDMGKRDFYGNKLTDTHNIGCYEGKGVKQSAGTKAPGTPLAQAASVLRFFAVLLVNLFER